MTKKYKETLARHAEICRFIIRQNLKDTFEQLDFWIKESKAWELSETCGELENTYRAMLGYAEAGFNDPERDKILERLIVAAFSLADDLKENALLQNSADNYEFSRIKDFRHSQAENTAQILSKIEEYDSALSMFALLGYDFTTSRKSEDDAFLREKMQAQLFGRWWLVSNHSADETADLYNFVSNEQASVLNKSIAISALTMSLIRHFSEQKMLFLFKVSQLSQEAVSQRALVGLIIALMRYKYRLDFYPEIKKALADFTENEEVKKRLLTVIIQFIRSFDTEALTKRIHKEIFPEISKITPLLRNKAKFDDVQTADDFEDKNPEWQDIIEQSGVADKLQEISELQLEGADVFMSTFSTLKHFPFFNETMNWFLPFSEQHTAVQKVIATDEKSLISLFSKNPVMCNSDKYSFCLSLASMPKSQRGMMSKGMAFESEELEKISSEEKLLNKQNDSEYISNQYIQDLYRFYKLYPYRADFANPFGGNLAFHSVSLLSRLGFGFEEKKRIADFYFSKNHFDKAIDLYENLITEAPTSAEIYQKIGYCYQYAGDFEKALEHYLKAETIKHNDSWTLKKIAFCYKMLRQYDNAFAYYQQVSEMTPDNTNLLLNVGHCLLNLRQYDEALAQYFKVEYLAPENANVRKAVAWCSFLANKLEQSQRYYKKLIDNAPTSDDFLNAGHVEWVSGSKTSALDFYQKSVEAGNLETFLSAFEQDRELLLQKGVEPGDIPLMLDMLRYRI